MLQTLNSLASRLTWCATLFGVALLYALALPAYAQTGAKSQVGVFYFPGWKDGELGLAYPKPWEPIRAYPEREPMLGWYDEGRQEVMDQHLTWMRDHGVSFVVFDWYWAGQRSVLGHALAAYHRSSLRAAVPYALMWANHGAGPKALADFDAMARELVEVHFPRPEYMRVQGRPVFYIMVPETLESRAQALGSDSTALIASLQRRAKAAGLPEILLVAGAGGGPGPVVRSAKRWGYGAYFTYNYHAGVGGRTRGEARFSRSFAELDAGYREHWDWFLSQGDLPYVVPMTAGWDKRPWGGSKDPAHDQSVPTEQEFLAHLRAGKASIQSNLDKTLGLGIICCWNEFGEGSIVEPTKALGFQRLRAVRDVFGRQ